MSEFPRCSIEECTIGLRVRYSEVDRMGVAHNSRYAVYFEEGRTELLRRNGMDYKTLEDAGVFLVVARLEVRFKAPARYDEELELTTRVGRVDRVRLTHEYTMTRPADRRIIATGKTELVHVDRDGRLQPLPEFLAPVG